MKTTAKTRKWESIDTQACNKVRCKYLGTNWLTIDEPIKVLQNECGFYKTRVPKELFLKHKLIEKRSDGEFHFSTTPWSYIQLRNCLEEIYKTFTEYQKNVRKANKPSVNREKECIDYLKSLGYKISKLVPEHYEEL